MRTTIDLPEHLVRQAKHAAASAGVTLAAFLEDAVREKLYREGSNKEGLPFVFPVFTGSAGVRRSVDLSNNREVWNLLEDGDGES